MLLNARKVFYEGNSHTTILLGIEDITTRRALEREREELLQKQQALLSEMCCLKSWNTGSAIACKSLRPSS